MVYAPQPLTRDWKMGITFTIISKAVVFGLMVGVGIAPSARTLVRLNRRWFRHAS